MILTGLSSGDGRRIIQKYLDNTSDLQSAALIVSRLLAAIDTEQLARHFASTAGNASQGSNNTTQQQSHASTSAAGYLQKLKNLGLATTTNKKKPTENSSNTSANTSASTSEHSALTDSMAAVVMSGEDAVFQQKILHLVQEYRIFLNSAELFVERAHLDIEITELRLLQKKPATALTSSLAQAQSPQSSGTSNAKSNKNNALTAKNSSKAISANKANNQKPGASNSSSNTSSSSNSSSNADYFKSLFKLPEVTQYAHVKLKCFYCAHVLPTEEIPTHEKQTQLRGQNTVVTSCTFCSKQLPRCYVCQLYLVIHLTIHLLPIYYPTVTHILHICILLTGIVESVHAVEEQ